MNCYGTIEENEILDVRLTYYGFISPPAALASCVTRCYRHHHRYVNKPRGLAWGWGDCGCTWEAFHRRTLTLAVLGWQTIEYCYGWLAPLLLVLPHPLMPLAH